MVSMTIRPADPRDRGAILDLAARTWEPVFASVNEILGPVLGALLHGEDWRTHHGGEVSEILDDRSTLTWVAEVDGRIVGFASARVVDPNRRIGEVQILGVDPSAQRSGVGAALTRHAEAWLIDQGMAVAFIGTGGDPGHAPARALYARLGYRPFPVVQFYRALDGREDRMGRPDDDLDVLAGDALAIGDIQSAAIFVVASGGGDLKLAAAAGIEGPPLEGLVNAVRNPAHPVARALTDDGPTFDVLPVNRGGPRLRSHLPLLLHGDGSRRAVGVLAVAHDQPLADADRGRLIGLADAAAAAAQ
jgi:GNAT superfamily N-acetyltransferase